MKLIHENLNSILSEIKTSILKLFDAFKQAFSQFSHKNEADKDITLSQRRQLIEKIEQCDKLIKQMQINQQDIKTLYNYSHYNLLEIFGAQMTGLFCSVELFIDPSSNRNLKVFSDDIEKRQNILTEKRIALLASKKLKNTTVAKIEFLQKLIENADIQKKSFEIELAKLIVI